MEHFPWWIWFQSAICSLWVLPFHFCSCGEHVRSTPTQRLIFFPLNDLNSTEPTLSDRWSADRSNWSRNFTKPAGINLAEAYFHLPKMSSGHSGLLHGNQSSTFVQKPHVVLFLKNLHHGKNNMGLFSFYCTNSFKKALLCRNVCTFPTAIQKFFSSFCTLI